MGEDMVIMLGKECLRMTALMSAPMLIAALVVGLVVSVFQAITQINEATLTFIPKMIVVAIVLVLAGPWMMDQMSAFTIGLFENISEIVR